MSLGFDVRHEKRLAVVMYGGVSLAIYINGVAQELYRLVKSTVDGLPPPETGTEEVYRRLAEKLGARFVIDILSGTSAGGINAVFLAKALSNAQPMDLLEELWLDEGEIDVLINDKRSAMEGLQTGFASPQSLLNGRRMYRVLLKALNDMEAARDPDARSRGGEPDPGWISELDLFVTATDLQGLRTPVSLSDRVVYEYRYRNVFHFQKSSDEARNDFTRETNPFLAYAARCTSSFPFAFEPMRLKDIEGAGPQPAWERFYPSYLIERDQVDDAVQSRHHDAQLTAGGKFDVFTSRAFADGGYLDNKPFSYAIDAIATRRSDVPVDRKLLYIEPSPESVRDELTILAPPNAVENSLKAFSLARYETIREDLQRIRERNRLIERVRRILDGTLEDIQRSPKTREPQSVENWLRDNLQEMIAREGVAYGGYLRLRVSKLTDDLAEIIARQAGFAAHSDLLRAVHELVRAWRDRHYYYYPGDPEHRENFNQFLRDFNLRFFLYRLRFTITNIDRLYRLADDKAVWASSTGGESGWSRPQDVVDRVRIEKTAEVFKKRLQEVRGELSLRLEEITKLRRWLMTPAPDSPMTQAVRAMGLGPREIVQTVLGKPREEDIRQAAEEIVRTHAGAFENIAGVIREVVDRADRHSDFCKLALGLGELKRADGGSAAGEELGNVLAEYLRRPIAARSREQRDHTPQTGVVLIPRGLPDRAPQGASEAAAWAAAFYFRRFPHYDLVAFPMLQTVELGEEVDPVEVIRISPEDSQALSGAGERKLGGSTLMHFGAFMDRTWRKNDILWGRLDGAERIISTLLAGTEHEAERDRFVKDAHAAIFAETFKGVLGAADGSEARRRGREMLDLLTAGLLGKDPQARDAVLEKMRKALSEQQLARLLDGVVTGTLDTAAVQDLFQDYEVDRRIEPRKALRVISRGTQVVGRMLGGIAEEQSAAGTGKRAAAWLTRAGRLLWGLVEVATPHSLASLFSTYWIHLALLIALILVVVGPVVSGGQAIRRFGVSLLLIVLVLSVTRWLLQQILARRSRRVRAALTAGAGLLAAVFLTLMGVGAVYLPEAWGKIAAWLMRLLPL